MNFIETERLILRDWQAQDFQPFAEMNSDPRVMEFMLKPLTSEETKAFFKKITTQIENQGFGLLATVLKDSNEFIGFVGLSIPNFQPQFTPCVEIGWRLAYKYWGNGYATEASRAVLKQGFEKYNFPEILSWTTIHNVRSRRVMEKLGMTHNPTDNFLHPMMPKDHHLCPHVLYRISNCNISLNIDSKKFGP
ncbi:MAG: GNAT family N-acetyltransferase [Verrucomicrobia bacterium]|nr:MAG: GNAT family N-acetyltransferase [Verrucomicrobiota bacterium]